MSKFLTNINLTQNELQNAVVQNLATAPATPKKGQIYTHSSNNVINFYDGSNWLTFATTSLKLSAFAATSSAELAGIISDETGTGSLVFATSPTFSTSLLTDSSTIAVFNTTATTVNAFGAATSLNLGASTGNTTINNNLIVTGNFTVNGTTTTVNSTTITVDDPIFVLGGDTAPTTDDNLDRGIEFRYHTGSAARIGFFGYDDSTGKFIFIPNATDTDGVISGTKGTIDANLEWADVLNKPDYTTTVTLTGDVTGTANVSGGTVSISTTIAANSVALGTDTTGDYVATVGAGTPSTQSGSSGLTISGTGEGSAVTIAHAETSSVTDLTASGRTYVTGLTFDTFGHVTAVTTGTETVTNTDTTYDISAVSTTGGAFLRLTAGGSGSGTDDVKFAGGGGISISQTDASTITISSTGVNDGTLTAAATTAGSTNTAVSLNFSTTYSANTATNTTINAVVGPALSALATIMTGATSGFLTKTGADTYALDTNTYTKKYSVQIGNGSDNSISVAHNLNTRAVQVTVYDSTTFEVVYPDVTNTTVNACTIAFAVAPTSNQYTVVVIG